MVHLSGILVVAERAGIDACRLELESLPGVSVHHADRPSGRMIAVVESADARGQEDGLRRIQDLPTVRLAALVEYRVDPDNGSTSEPPELEEPREGVSATSSEVR